MNLLNFLVNGAILYGPFAGCFESLLSLKAGGSFILFCVSFVSHMVGKGLPADDKVKKACWEVPPGYRGSSQRPLREQLHVRCCFLY